MFSSYTSASICSRSRAVCAALVQFQDLRDECDHFSVPRFVGGIRKIERLGLCATIPGRQKKKTQKMGDDTPLE
jgi:hypothetical protein